MFAKQVRVKERLQNGELIEYGAIWVKDMLIAMDNGQVLDPKDKEIEIIKILKWISLSDELLGN